MTPGAGRAAASGAGGRLAASRPDPYRQRDPLPTSTDMLSKQHLIERIRDLNHSALREWLDVFSDGQLRRYLEHLQLMHQPRDGRSRWVSDGVIPAVMAHAPE